MPPTSTPALTTQMLREITDPFGVYCVLELRLPQTQAESRSVFHVFPVMPESMKIAQRYLQTITPTQGGVFVDEFGRAPSPIVLQGTFGRSPNIDIRQVVDFAVNNNFISQAARAGLQQDPNSSQFLGTAQAFSQDTRPTSATESPVTGYKLAKLLSLMVDMSHEVDPSSGQCPQAFFYNFAFGQFYEVALNSFQAQMSVEANGLWVYQLEMTTLRPVGSQTTFRRSGSADAALLDLLTRPAPSGTVTQQRLLRRQTIFNNIQRVRAVVLGAATVANRLRGGDALSFALSYLDTKFKLEPGTLSTLYTSLETLPQTLETVRQAILSPKRVYSELANDLSALKSNISSAWADLTGTLAQYERTANEQLQQAYTAQSFALGLASSDWNGELTAATEELTFLVDAIEAAQSGLDQIAAVEVLAEVLGSSSLPPVNSSSAANSAFVTSGSASATAYSVHQGDTLAGIAARVYGSADLWPAVAERLPDEMQGLSPTQPLDAYVGVGITVPDSVGGTQDLVPYVWETPVGLGCLGRDLPAEFTLQTRSDGTTTLTTLDYQDTLLQGLGQRIALPPGSSADTPEFGSTLFSAIGQNFGVLQRQMTYAFVQEAILSDPRIGSLESLEVFQQQDALAIRFNVRTANNVSLSSDELVVTST